MQSCECGTTVPFEPCPTCPNVEWLCPSCGAVIMVKPIPMKEYVDVVRRFKERQNAALKAET